MNDGNIENSKEPLISINVWGRWKEQKCILRCNLHTKELLQVPTNMFGSCRIPLVWPQSLPRQDRHGGKSLPLFYMWKVPSKNSQWCRKLCSATVNKPTKAFSSCFPQWFQNHFSFSTIKEILCEKKRKSI